MVHCWVIADRESCGTNELCRQWIDAQYNCLKESIPSVSIEQRIIPQLSLTPTRFMGDVRESFHEIAEILGAAIGDVNPSDRFVAILDARLWNDLSEMPSLQSVQGLLILAFPDVLWVPVFKGEDQISREHVKLAVELALGGFNPIFDGMGVRSKLIRTHKTNSAYPYNRDDVAVSIDEEKHFAELAAYTAFRFGYRVYPVSTARLAEQVLSVSDKTKLPSFARATVSSDSSLIVFEDGYIEFPDLTQRQNKAHLLGDGRDNVWPLLKSANLRVLATAAGSEEKIARKHDKGAPDSSRKAQISITADSWFRGADVKDLRQTKMKPIQSAVEKARRQAFNLFAGGLADVWVWNIVKCAFIVWALVWLLIYMPIMFIPSLFLIFGAFGLCRNIIVKGMLFLFGHHSRVQTFFKIRSQWRFCPKLYTNHFPQHQIQSSKTRYWCLVGKPLGGIFGLRNQCGLPNGCHFDGQLNAQMISHIFHNALKGMMPTITGTEVPDSNHSAYGMTLDVATDLIDRARTIKDRGKSIEDAIHAAVLSTCAYELLGHKTPALSIEALGLRHYCEVLAECEFPGVRARLDMEDRWVDLHNSLWQICRSSNGAVREEMFESGMSAICGTLSELLRSRGRNEEAAFLSRQSRYMHRLLLSPVPRNLLAFPEWAVRGKLNFCLSFALFVGVFVWYYHAIIDPKAEYSFVLSKMYELLFSTQPDMGIEKLLSSTWNGTVPKIWGQGFDPKEAVQLVTTVVQAMRQLALIHIGFLAALFYDFMHRK